MLVHPIAIALLCAAQTTAALTEAAATLANEAEQKSKAGQFEEAASLYERAYAVDPKSEFLYEAAKAHEAAGEIDDAVEAYAKYLATSPNPPRKHEVENKLAALGGSSAEPETTREPPPESSTAHVPARHRPQTHVGPWLVIAGGAAGLATGVVFGALAAQKRKSAVESPTNADATEFYDSAQSLASMANVAYAAGAGVAAAGLVWLIVAKSDEPPPIAAAISPGGVSISGQF